RPTPARHDRPACASAGPHQRSRGQHARVLGGVLLQTRAADGEAGRQGLQGLVIQYYESSDRARQCFSTTDETTCSSSCLASEPWAVNTHTLPWSASTVRAC